MDAVFTLCAQACLCSHHRQRQSPKSLAYLHFLEKQPHILYKIIISRQSQKVNRIARFYTFFRVLLKKVGQNYFFVVLLYGNN